MENTSAQKVEQIQEEHPSTEVTVGMPLFQQLDSLKDLDEVYTVTASYRTQEDWHQYKGQEIRCIFMGLKDIPNKEGESVNYAIIATENEIFLAAQHVLVEAVKKFPPNTNIRIIYEGKKKNANSDGYTNIFNVALLGKKR